MNDGRARGPSPAFLALFVLSLLSLAFYLRFRSEAFPEHAIEFAVGRQEAGQRAAAFLGELGLGVDGYRSATVFRVDEGAKTYLEQELGVQATTALAGQTDLWHFTTRYFRPLQKEELQVAVAPDGRVVGFRHLVDEAAPGARLSAADAVARAEAFRRERAGAEGDWRIVEQVSVERPNRLDWRLTWERAEPTLPAAGGEPGALRVGVLLQGDRVGEYRQFVKVPEAWQRAYARSRSSNSLVQTLDTVFGMLPLALAMLVVSVRRFVRRDLRIVPAVWLGIVGGVLGAAAVANTLPTASVAYHTTDAWESFLLQFAIGAGLAGIAQGLVIFLFAVAGEALYRQHFPNLLALGPSFGWRGLTSWPGARALAVGGLLSLVMAAYQVVYYFVGRAVGFWTPADVPYDDLFSALVPWLYPAVVGYTAATFEEFSFRLFGIPLLMVPLARLLRSQRAGLWAAIVVTAVVWAFLHSTYPQDPWYARGLEISLVGIAFGALMVRFGILASVAVHYAFNAFVTAIVLDKANDLPSSLAAYAIAALPLLVAAYAYARARRVGFSDAAPLLNRAQAPPEPPEIGAAAPPPAWRYDALPRGRRLTLAAVAAAAALLVVGTDLTTPPERAVALNRDEAAQRARAALTAADVVVAGDPGSLEQVVALDTRPAELARAYLREQADDGALEAYAEAVPPLLWHARFFRPLERDEYRVLLRVDAGEGDRPFAVVRDLAQTTPGARLAPAEARRLAEAHLAGVPGWSPGGWSVVDEGTIERPARLDHRFVFERADRRFGEATLRAELQVVGDRVSGYRPFLKLPEEWERARTGTGLREMAAGLIPFLLVAWLAGTAVTTFLRLARERVLAWRPALLVGGAFLVLALAETLNGLPTLYRGYPTALPVETFLTQWLAGQAATLGTTTALAGAVAALLVGLWREGVAPALAPTDRRAWALDALLGGVGLPVVLLGVVRVVDLIGLGGSLGPTNPALGPPAGAASLVPAVAALSGLRLGALAVALALVAALLLRRATGRDRLVVAVALLLPLSAALGQRTWPDALETLGLGTLAVLVAAAAARWVLRRNLLAYLVAAISLVALAETRGLLRTADPWLQWNGLAVLLGLGLGLGLIWARARMRRWTSESA